MRTSPFIVAIAGAFITFTPVQSQTPSASPSATKPGYEHSGTRTFTSPCQPIVDVCDVIHQYATLTHFKVIRNNFAQGKVAMDDVSGLAPDKAIEIIEHTLFADGFPIIQIDSDTVEIWGPVPSARSLGVPVISDIKQLPSHERLVSFVFSFRYRSAEEMANKFAQHLSPPQSWFSIQAEPKSNTVLLTERTSVIRRLIDIAAKMDVPDRKKEP